MNVMGTVQYISYKKEDNKKHKSFNLLASNMLSVLYLYAFMLLFRLLSDEIWRSSNEKLNNHISHLWDRDDQDR